MTTGAMTPGRELDVLVHRLVMGRFCELFLPTGGEFGSDLNGWYDTPLQIGHIPQPVLRYSTYISAAWKVVERMRKASPVGPDFELLWGPEPDKNEEWVASFGNSNEPGRRPVEATGVTAPLAICLAALLAVKTGDT